MTRGMGKAVWVLALPVTGSALFLAWRALHGGMGFPLDDAWIHQTYARNLVHTGQWAYVPGHTSAGSTSPLWTLLIAPAYVLGVDFRLWTYALGVLALMGVVWAVWRLLLELSDGNERLALASALFCALEWHLLWAALSGMETALFAFLSLLALGEYTHIRRAHGFWEFGRPVSFLGRAFWTGMLIGLAALTRPEALLLAGLMMVDLTMACFMAVSRRGKAAGVWMLAAFSVGVALCLMGYLAFNIRVSGRPFPNTFYAKAAEYRELVEKLPLGMRFWRVTFPTLVGAQALLVPGFVMAVLRELRGMVTSRLRKGLPLPLIWWGALLGAYALRLPVDYQHGRYTIPCIPLFVALGFWGMSHMMPGFLAGHRLAGSALLDLSRLRWVLSRVWAISTGITLVLFVFIGARAYNTDVGIIQCEMVQTAFWLRENTPPEALIAVHDIGAIGYYAGRPLLDLAGLVTPEVIPFIRDEDRLEEFILDEGADYLVTFPSWYPRLVRSPSLRMIYSTGCTLTLQAGGDNMAVYEIRGAWVRR